MNTKNVWAHWRCCHSESLHCLKAYISLNIVHKELKLSPLLMFHKVFKYLESLCINHDAFPRQSRMLMRQNLNNDVSA